MLIKQVDLGSFYDPTEQTVQVIDFDRSHGMIKAATDSQIQNFVAQLQPKPGKVYLHILAMGAGEYYGANRNADIFYEDNLLKCHKTFETTGFVYRNHKNKDPSIAMGKVIYSIYNHRMHRVELIVEIDVDRAYDVIQRVESGDFPATSMACRTPSDTCSICGNVAHTRQEYCVHLREELGRIYPDGRKVSAINDQPLTFIDISIVVRPADVTSSVLQKVASHGEDIIGSAEQAELDGILESGISKKAAINKLSEFIKNIDANVVDYDPSAEALLKKVRDPDHKLIDALVNFNMNEILDTMAHLGISPSVKFLAELIGRKTIGNDAIGIGELVEQMVGETGVQNMELPVDMDIPEKCMYNSNVSSNLLPYLGDCSLAPNYVEKRAYDYPRYFPETGVGYSGNGPYVEPNPYERYREMQSHIPDEHSGIYNIVKTLLSIGGAALAAKWYITRVIDQKLKESAIQQEYQAKINLVKNASELKVTSKLAYADMIRTIRPHKG